LDSGRLRWLIGAREGRPRRLAKGGETDEPREAGAMLANLLRQHRPGPDVLHTLRRLHSLLKRGNHLLISDGVIYEP